MANTLGFQLYSLRQFDGGWSAAFDAVKSLGIDSIEVWSGGVPDNPDVTNSLDEIKTLLARSNMHLTCGHITVAEYENRYEDWKDLLIDFGSRTWVIPFADANSLEEWLGLLPTFREMAARLAADGLALGYHNHHMELVRYGDKYVMEHLLDNMPELQAQFHIGQFLPDRGIALPDWIHKYEGRVCALHLNDTNADGPAPLGAGICRAEDSIKAALDTGVDTFIMEVDLTQGSLGDVARDVEFARKLIG
jgi:sugar phosphate isomerase/epimerase